MSSQSKRAPTAGQTLLAGGAAGGLESLITYPTEYVKTQQQLMKGTSRRASPLSIFVDVVRNKGILHLYRGAGAFGVSNASKSAVRFFTFDMVRNQLPKKNGKSTTLSNLLAGFAAGVAESVAVVTPGETLKTRLIDDVNRPGGPRYNGTFAAVRDVVHTQGIKGLWTGVVPVTLKQASNAVVRFTSYNLLLEQFRALSGDKYRGATSMCAGGLAGIITVYCTMPLDNLKTRLQAIGASERYSGSLNCLTTVVRVEGVKALWKGTTPRLMRLMVFSLPF
jgi:solute carrier family 25 citrate transporter 1